MDCDNLLILLSKETLYRMWCAGEICTAVNNKVPISAVACDDYVVLDEEALAKFDGDVWTEEQKHTLYTYGMEIPMIKDAYRNLSTIKSVPFKRFSSSRDQERAIEEVSKNLHNFPLSSTRPKIVDPKPAKIAVVGNTSDAEALCICEVLREMVQVRVQQETEVIRSVDETEMHAVSAKYILVIFTKGVLRDLTFADILLTMCESGNVRSSP
jgi:acid stress-induced BolA-like protein IbaG/YrbA